jgi:hypothetical protein
MPTLRVFVRIGGQVDFGARLLVCGRLHSVYIDEGFLMPKITAKFIDKEVMVPEHGQVILRDTALRGFGLRVTKGSMSYIAECRVNGRPRRVTIGRCDLLTPEEARKEARKRP